MNLDEHMFWILFRERVEFSPGFPVCAELGGRGLRRRANAAIMKGYQVHEGVRPQPAIIRASEGEGTLNYP